MTKGPSWRKVNWHTMFSKHSINSKQGVLSSPLMRPRRCTAADRAIIIIT